jgi:hypothetical protein
MSSRSLKRTYSTPPGNEDKIITADESKPRAMQEAAGKPIAPKRLTNPYSRRPMPFRLIGIMDIKVMTGTNTRK